MVNLQEQSGFFLSQFGFERNETKRTDILRNGTLGNVSFSFDRAKHALLAKNFGRF